MKKLGIIIGLFGFLALSLTFAEVTRAESLFQYFKDTGRKFMGCNQERKFLAAEKGVFGYDCSSKKNKELRGHLKIDDERLGFSVVSRYRTTLSASLTSTATTVNVSSMRTFDDTTLTMNLLGDKVFLTIDPGNSKEEIIRCTGISGNSWTGCTRGLAFSGTSTAAVANNQKAHTSGAIIIMSNVHYVYEELIDKETNEDVTGTKRFLSNLKLGDGTVNTHKTVFADTTGGANLPFWRYNASTSRWQISDNGTDTLNIVSSSGSGLDPGIGIAFNGSLVNWDPAPTSTSGLGFCGDLACIVSSSASGISSNADGIRINTSTAHVWSASTTFSGNVFFNSNVTTTNATSTGYWNMATSTMTSSSIRQANIEFASTTNLSVGPRSINTLATNSTTPAEDYHHHPRMCEAISGSYASGDSLAAGANVSFSHRLGWYPSYVIFNARFSAPTANTGVSNGWWASSTNGSAQFASAFNTGGAAADTAIASAVIHLLDSDNTVESSATMNTPTNTLQINLTVGTNVNAGSNAARRFTALLCK